jgi:hypothetical protein
MDMLKKIPTHMDYVGQGRAEKLYQIIIGNDRKPSAGSRSSPSDDNTLKTKTCYLLSVAKLKKKSLVSGVVFKPTLELFPPSQ